MPGAGNRQDQDLGRAARTDRGPGRAAAWREHRHGRARHGELRPVAAAPGAAARRLAQHARPPRGLRRRPRARQRAALRHAGGRDRRLRHGAGDHRARARPGQARARRRRGRATDRADHRGRRERRAAVRPRALGAGECRGRARRPHRHLAGQSGVCLAQPGAGGDHPGLRMVQAHQRRRAAVRDAAEIDAGAEGADGVVLHRSGTRARRGSSFSGRRKSTRPCWSTCATSSPAWSRPGRTSRPCMA